MRAQFGFRRLRLRRHLCSSGVIVLLFLLVSTLTRIFAFDDDPIADVVLGQPDFTSNVPNSTGVNASSLNYPWVLQLIPERIASMSQILLTIVFLVGRIARL